MGIAGDGDENNSVAVEAEFVCVSKGDSLFALAPNGVGDDETPGKVLAAVIVVAKSSVADVADPGTGLCACGGASPMFCASPARELVGASPFVGEGDPNKSVADATAGKLALAVVDELVVCWFDAGEANTLVAASFNGGAPALGGEANSAEAAFGSEN